MKFFPAGMFMVLLCIIANFQMTFGAVHDSKKMLRAEPKKGNST
eukprot:CAMPEP_0194768650 /NCGR_PEP_ID=MMETSP0323_2-20130528/40319_1 /TAXON_ID=2866 ORGANISM="Crypthecodinium cohnii, Strain Seligo" /NCGR_SAMPLE_ID=MMETSP0323_2 /ASSEMBLY_ACC=CAM_ASM_000346 /LENGTH=43 /DNA_ID= /DNA_START= /DNA_END= /DNA_ORIENTATION=